jgi:hypothetical protein
MTAGEDLFDKGTRNEYVYDGRENIIYKLFQENGHQVFTGIMYGNKSEELFMLIGLVTTEK